MSRNSIPSLIKDVSINDMGTYPFEVTINSQYGNETRTKNLELVVYKEPSLDIIFEKNKLLPYFKIGKTYSLNCNINGYPINSSSVEFFYTKCENFPNQEICSENDRIKLQTSPLNSTDGGLDPRYHYSFTSLSSVTTKTNMKLGCKACTMGSLPKCGLKSHLVLVSEQENGFEIIGLEHNKKYYEGDDVTIKCVASKYSYTHVSWKVKNEDCKRKKRSLENSEQSDQKYDRASLINICDVETMSEDSEHSLIKTITLKNIGPRDSGVYSCYGEKNDSNSHSKKRTLVVLPIVAPKVISTNMNGSASVNVEEEFTMFCQIKGDPPPSITWYKDGVLGKL